MENQVQKPNVAMCVLAYLGILSLIPFLAEKEDAFVQYHAKQGVNLFIIEVIVSIICSIISWIPIIGIIGTLLSGITGILFLVLAILGIVSACKGEQKELPIIGGIKFIK